MQSDAGSEQLRTIIASIYAFDGLAIHSALAGRITIHLPLTISRMTGSHPTEFAVLECRFFPRARKVAIRYNKILLKQLLDHGRSVRVTTVIGYPRLKGDFPMPKHQINSSSGNISNTAPWNTLPPTGPILRPAEAARYFGVSLSTYYELIHAGVVPPFLKLSHRARASGVPQPWLDAAIAGLANCQRP